MRIKIVIPLLAVAMLTACEKSLPVYDFPDDALNFEVTLDEITGEAIERNFSFVYQTALSTDRQSDVKVDTVWVTARTQGFLSTADRSFELQQISAGTERADAVAGQHYISFDDAEMKGRLVVLAGANSVRFPVVVRRDASLADGDVSLYFQLRPNQNFGQGLEPLRTVKLVISDRLAKPTSWSDYYFGAYGQVKHRFMIDHTGLRWDDDFIRELVSGDWGYIQYLAMLLARELESENASRARQGLKPLAEADGREVSFGWGASF